MANTKEYKIVINGLQESITAVDALNESLNLLDKRIKELEGKAVKVGTSSSGGGSKSSSTSSLSEEEKLARQIAQIDEKRVAYSKELYQNYLAAKDVLKETVNDQKQLAAAERLQADSYSNTMNGLKEKLADLKSVHFTTDMSSDEFQKQTQEINELTTKLKQLEEAYGQFGRNVGNYKSAADGFSKYKIEVGGVVREFNSAQEAAKTLRKELLNLPKGAKGAKELRDALHDVKSQIKDIEKSSPAMDNLLDTMESFTAIGQITNGFSAFFGFDNDEIQRSIQKLVALQNAMQGIEKINKQLSTKEGIGNIIAKGNDAIDATNFKIKRLIVSMQGTGTAAKVAATGVNLLTTAAKALSKIGVAALFSAAAWAIEKIVSSIADWVKGNSDLESSEKNLKIAIDSTNETLERRLELNRAKENAGRLSSTERLAEDEKAYAEAIMEANKELEKRASIDPKNYTFAKAYTGGQTWDDFLENDKGVTTLGGFSETAKNIDELTKRYNALSAAVDKNTGLVYKNEKGIEIAHLTASDVKDDLNHIEQFMGGQLLHTMTQFNLKTEEGRKGLSNWVNGIMSSNDDLRKSILLKLPEIVSNNEGKFGDALTNYLTHIKTFVRFSNQEMNVLNFEGFANKILDAADKTGKRLKEKQLKELDDRYNALSKEEQKAQGLLYAQSRQTIIKGFDDTNKKVNEKITSNYKKEQKTVQDAEKELARLRIDQMKEGLNKTLKQLEEERRQKISKIKSDGVMVAELTLETNKYYDQKIEEEKKKHAENVEKIYKDMWKNIQDQAVSNAQRELELIEKEIEQEGDFYDKGSRFKARNKGIGTYGIQGKEQLSPTTQETLGITSTIDSKFMNDMKKYIDLLRETSTAESEYTSKLLTDSDDWDEARDKFSELNERLRETEKNLESLYGKESFDNAKNQLLSEGYSSSLSGQIEQRLAFIDEQYALRIDREEKNIKKWQDAAIKAENDSYKKISGETWANYQKQLELAEDYAKAKVDAINAAEERGEITPEKANEERLKVNQEYWVSYFTIHKNGTEEIAQLEKEHQANLKQIDKKGTEQRLATNAEYYKGLLQEMRDAQTAIAELESKQPVMNAWGFTNWNKTDANNQKLLDAYIKQAVKIAQKRQQLQAQFDDGLVDKNIYESTMREFDALANGIGEKMDKVKQEMSLGNKIGTLIQEAQQYINAVGNAFSTVLNALWDADDAAYKKYIEELDKSIEEAQKRYDKQKKLTEEYADNVNSIEDELSNARGARRQQLIDQLNAQMAAQRESLAQEKKIEKEQEKLKADKEREEQKQREREHDRAVTQAIISAALATANALATTPFIPTGLAMGTLAAALGAAQIAIIKSQKYGDGGVIEGKSHAAGGVKVLGGRAEVEGGEFITNKATTAKNVELLEYINSKRKRINLDDMIEFYSDGKAVRKSISSIRTKFADGGQIPTLRNDIDLTNGLMSAFEDYANKPTVVQVVDIVNAQDRLNKVKVMAGLTD